MAAISKRRTNRQAVGVFYRADRLKEALQALASIGVEATALSLLAQEEAIEVRLRRSAGTAEDEGMASLLESLVDLDGACGTRVCAAGPLVGPLRRAEAVRTDGAHPYFAKWLPARLARMLQDQLDDGGLLFWVIVRDGLEEQRVGKILLRHSEGSIQIHDVPLPSVDDSPMA